jgi:hypothetical protein
MAEVLGQCSCDHWQHATGDNYKSSGLRVRAPQWGGGSTCSRSDLFRMEKSCQPLTKLRMPAESNFVGHHV